MNIINTYIDNNIYKLIFIGIIAGIIASFIGGGSEIVIVPLLLYLNVITDYKTAIGTSLASLLLPIGIVAVYFYSKKKCNNGNCVKWNYAIILSLSFIIGTFTSYYTSDMNNDNLKLIFAILLISLGLIIIFKEFKLLK